MHKILIVDDHSVIRRLLCISLNKDYEILEAQDGRGALEIIADHHPKIVLLDVMMPGTIDGLQVLDAIKANPLTQDILVAMVTARGQAADHDNALKRGADAYFIKPFSPRQVLAWVQSQLPST